MKTENARIRSRVVAPPQIDMGHTQVVAHPVDAMVQAGGTAPDTNGAMLGKNIGDLPALFSQFGQMQKAGEADNKKQGAIDAMNGKEANKPSYFSNVGVGYDEGYYASKDEMQGMAFSTAFKNAVKENDNFSNIDDPVLLEQKLNETYTNLHGKYFDANYMGSRKEITYEGATRVTQGRMEVMQDVMNIHTGKRIETKLTGAFSQINDYMDAVHTTGMHPEVAVKALKSQMSIAYENLHENVTRDQFDSMIVQRISQQAGDLSQSGDGDSAKARLSMLRDLYGDKQIPGKNGEATSRYGPELDALESQITRNINARDVALEKAKDNKMEENSSGLLSEAYALDTMDIASVNNLRERALALAKKNELKSPKTVLETIDAVTKNEGFARHDNPEVFQKEYVNAVKGPPYTSLEHIVDLKNKLTNSSWLHVLNTFNNTSKYQRSEARSARHERNVETSLDRQVSTKFATNLERQTTTQDDWNKAPDPYNAVRQGDAEFTYYKSIESFTQTHKRPPSIDELHDIKTKAVSRAWEVYPAPQDSKVGSVDKPNSPSSAKPAAGHPTAKPTTLPKEQLKAPPAPVTVRQQTISVLDTLDQ